MATDGLVSLTSVHGAEIVVTKFTADEFNSGDMRACEQRINHQLGRTDLRIADLVRAGPLPSAEGLSFRKFLGKYKRPALFFSDILAGSGEAQVVREEAASEYTRAGGTIRVLGEV